MNQPIFLSLDSTNGRFFMQRKQCPLRIALKQISTLKQQIGFLDQENHMLLDRWQQAEQVARDISQRHLSTYGIAIEIIARKDELIKELQGQRNDDKKWFPRF